MEKKKAKGSNSISLIVTDEVNPALSLREGMKFEVVGVTLLDSQLKNPKAGAARLCGGTNTCVALIDLGVDEKK